VTIKTTVWHMEDVTARTMAKGQDLV